MADDELAQACHEHLQLLADMLNAAESMEVVGSTKAEETSQGRENNSPSVRDLERYVGHDCGLSGTRRRKKRP